MAEARRDCAGVLAAIGPHWMTEAQLARITGMEAARVRRCAAEATERGELETPRGVYRGTMWRRAGHHSS